MEPVDYNERLHSVYARSHELSPATLEAWLAAFGHHLPPPPVDLGKMELSDRRGIECYAPQGDPPSG